jgi:DNA-binding NarL/FixJ family response regulator
MSEARAIQILVVDDHPLMRSGITGEINSQSDMRVVAEASSAREAVEQFRRHRPDVTLMDIRMPDGSGIQALTEIRAEFPHACIVLLTTATGDVNVTRAFQAGAMGYLMKNLLRTELIDTIRYVHGGKRRIPSEIAQQMAEHMSSEDLTARELDVLRAVAQGRSNKVVGAALGISEHTVKNHLKNILMKLDATDRTHAVMIAMRRGYLEM